jgi:hypothetical protein
LENPDFGPLFERVTARTFRHEVPMTADRLVALIATRSYFLVAPPEQQADIARQVRELAAELPETFPLPYDTHVYKARRTPAGAGSAGVAG